MNISNMGYRSFNDNYVFLDSPSSPSPHPLSITVIEFYLCCTMIVVLHFFFSGVLSFIESVMEVNSFRLDGGECYDSDEGDGDIDGDGDGDEEMADEMVVETIPTLSAALIVGEIEKGPATQLLFSHQSLKNTSLKYKRNRPHGRDKLN